MDELREKLAALTETINQKEQELRTLRKSVESLWDELEVLIQDAHREEQGAQGKSASPPEPVWPEASEAPEAAEGSEEEAEEPSEEKTAEKPGMTPDPASPTPPTEEEAREGEGAGSEKSLQEGLRARIETGAKSMQVGDRPSVQERFTERKTLSDRMGQQRVGDLKRAMDVNERFLYANELFGGDMSAFSQAVQELNHISSLEDATRMMDEQLCKKYNWDEESKVTIGFRNLVARRFA